MNYEHYWKKVLGCVSNEDCLNNQKAIYELDRLIKRQVKRKPHSLSNNIFRCSKCNAEFKGKNIKYCYNCGVEIEWGLK